ncbi:LexA family transcriptional regulator [Pseudomonas graminis]|uniref:Putative HTH-type transcriptional regulator n=1 Tax=Pseudomonas graminis TaxID=158627 RepID=A0A6M8MCL3_9PSED|nr:LexA family transcriptional regulator [Pseudomonas graminis]QKF52794.1 putative HTH-type transcriptional regulator [Pseudomonas graminis]
MSKKKELSPELKAECDAAKALFVSRKNALGLTQASLAESADISAAAVAMYLNGTNPLNAKFAVVFSRLLGVPVEKFSKRLAKEINGLTVASEQAVERGESATALDLVRQLLDKQGKGIAEDVKARLLAAAKSADRGEVMEHDSCRPGAVGDEVWITHLDMRAAVGGAYTPHHYPEILQDVRVSPRHLRDMGVEFREPRDLKLVTGWGQSMAPTIKHRDPMLVDTSVREFAGDGIYMFCWEDRHYIKRLQWVGEGELSMISDDTRFPPQSIRAKDADIQARALLVWNATLI